MIAFAFFHPYLLYGLALGSIPVIIHLFHRRKFRTVWWAAMKFLLSSSKLTARRLKILQILLLITRVLILVLLVLALARPLITGASFAGFLTTARTAAVVILDNSYSMGYRGESVSDFEIGKSIAADLSSIFQRGDSLTYILMSLKPHIISQAISNPESFRRIIKTSKISDGGTDVLSSIIKGLEILKREKQSQKELFIITDCRKNGWRIDDASGWDKVNAMLAKFDVKPKVYVIDISSGFKDNYTISDAWFPDYPPELNKSYSMEFIAKSSLDEAKNKPVFSFYFDNDKNVVSRVEGSEFEDGISTAKIQFEPKFAGFHWGKVRLEADPLQVDNERYFILNVKESLPVLCIDGAPSTTPFESGIDYVRFALAPEKGKDVSEDIRASVSNILEAKVIEWTKFWEIDLNKYEIVILSNLSSIPRKMYDSLKNFVFNGGGLIIFSGDNVRAEEYEKLYSEDEKRLLPAILEKVKGRIPSEGSYLEREDQFYTLSEFDFNHPVMRGFKDAKDGDLTTIKFYKFFDTAVDEKNPDIKILARFDNGSPFIIERKYGRGKAILFTSSCDARWSNFPLKPVFLPLLHRLVHYLWREGTVRYNLTVGEPITLPANLASLTEPVYIINPRGNIFKVLPSFTRTEAESSETDSGIPYIIFENTELSGIYRLKMKPATGEKEEKLSSSDIYFALNVDTKESDLTPIDARVLKGLIKSADFSYFKGTDNVLSNINEDRFGREIWRYLFIFILAFLVCESILAHQIDKT